MLREGPPGPGPQVLDKHSEGPSAGRKMAGGFPSGSAGVSQDSVPQCHLWAEDSLCSLMILWGYGTVAWL